MSTHRSVGDRDRRLFFGQIVRPAHAARKRPIVRIDEAANGVTAPRQGARYSVAFLAAN
jgi:hypothetical protein